jgi:catechol 2,3-dioxygenase-like lactoylglutathione lyase family enzyme
MTNSIRVQGLDHINITAPMPVIDKTRQFYVDVLGLVDGFRPDFGVGGYWLYSGDQAIIHLFEGADTEMSNGYLDHVAFQCAGLNDTIIYLNENGMEYRQIEIKETGQTLLFVIDPAGVKVELNFHPE